MPQLVYSVFTSNNGRSYYLREKENLVKHQKSLKILWKWLPGKFYFGFYVFTHSYICLRFVDIWVRIYFIFPRNVVKKLWKPFNIKFQLQWKSRKSSYQVRQILTLICSLIALILGKKSAENLRVTKMFKEINFEGASAELESKKWFQRQ